MTIAAASFFTTPLAGAPAPTTPPTTQLGFAEAFASALTTTTGDAVSTAVPPQPAAATPLPIGPIAANDVAPPLPSGNLPATAAIAPVPSPTEFEPPATASTTCAEPIAPTEVAEPGGGEPTADGSSMPKTNVEPSPGRAPTLVPSDVVSAGTVTLAEAVTPSTMPIAGPPREVGHAEDEDVAAEPSDVDVSAEPATRSNASAPAIVMAVATQIAPSSGVRSSAPEPDADEPVSTGRTETAAASGKVAATADAPREAAPAATPVVNFGERLASVERTDAQPPSAPGAIGGTTVQPTAARVADASAALAAPPPEPTVTGRPGQIGREMGVEIAKRLGVGGEELTVRLNPVEMGRIEVRLSFDERGTLRAAVTAESAPALEMLRRDSADLGRALTEAGVRADADSFRFDSQSNGREGGQFWQRQQAANGRQRAFGSGGADEPTDPQPVYRTLRASGRVNLVA